MEDVGAMVVMEQVVPDDQDDPKQDRRVVLFAQIFGHTKCTIVVFVQEVFPTVETFSP